MPLRATPMRAGADRVKVHRDFHVEGARVAIRAQQYLGRAPRRPPADRRWCNCSITRPGEDPPPAGTRQAGHRPRCLPGGQEKTTYAMRDVASLARRAAGTGCRRRLCGAACCTRPAADDERRYTGGSACTPLRPRPVDTACARPWNSSP